MRALALAALLLTACGGLAPARACVDDAACAGDLVCSTTAGGICTALCATDEFCVAAMGAGFVCRKYVGPSSAGYACEPP